ncbi:YajQ family cyclic di-GMP-binding protein [Psittacicella melopsittaci]|uniref:Nucleotide-binding protein CJP74_04590 n=1 Tax=Psittacicella melopsittaci TaxID=2028576 RepID=A0A3A1Y2F3_9GAMM|nr:YajQ family cyclic di-GMP-binding protein [Psittacicella melopsittaci]RIY32413.1 YajQ family cyclic di-GMP-binding protein [Psittacicella melopsittaci]
MPSFDIVSEIDNFEVKNTVENAQRVLGGRFDFKGTNASIELNAKDNKVKLVADSDFQLQQLVDILVNAAIKRNIEFYSLQIPEEHEHAGKTYSKEITFKNGIDQDTAKKITKMIKETKLKVTAQIQGEKIRVQGKNRDDLQQVIALMRNAQSELNLALQFENFRD